MDRGEALVERLLRSTRTIAVVGASPRPARHSHAVARYLHKSGYDVIPVRSDRVRVGELPTYARLEDVAGPVDLVVIFRRPEAGAGHVQEAAAKRAGAVWFPPGAWSREAADEASSLGLTVVKDRCIMEEHRHLFGAIGEAVGGHPKKTGVHERRRKPTVEDVGHARKMTATPRAVAADRRLAAACVRYSTRKR